MTRFGLRPCFSGSRVLCLVALGLGATPLGAQTFRLPTANHALYEKGGEERFFVGTTGKSWESGTFGCVRSDGAQFHEGLDIRCLQRDKKGEPTDPVLATANGTVSYINRKPSLSNYGNYLIIRHQVDGVEIYSLYAHLREVREDLAPGQAVKAGEIIGVMGRTANTHEGISKDRAHVHFELNLLVNERYALWHKRKLPKQRNDHGNWNGQNLLGLDPRRLFLAQRQQGTNFNLIRFIQDQPELCRVLVRKTAFPWLKRYPTLVQSNPKATAEGIAGYELVLNFNGIPFVAIPRAASELKKKSSVALVSVNETEAKAHACRKLLTNSGGRRALTTTGANLIDLLIF